MGLENLHKHIIIPTLCHDIPILPYGWAIRKELSGNAGLCFLGAGNGEIYLMVALWACEQPEGGVKGRIL